MDVHGVMLPVYLFLSKAESGGGLRGPFVRTRGPRMRRQQILLDCDGFDFLVGRLTEQCFLDTVLDEGRHPLI